jgi:hypothetical protein
VVVPEEMITGLGAVILSDEDAQKLSDLFDDLVREHGHRELFKKFPKAMILSDIKSMHLKTSQVVYDYK